MRVQSCGTPLRGSCASGSASCSMIVTLRDLSAKARAASKPPKLAPITIACLPRCAIRDPLARPAGRPQQYGRRCIGPTSPDGGSRGLTALVQFVLQALMLRMTCNPVARCIRLRQVGETVPRSGFAKLPLTAAWFPDIGAVNQGIVAVRAGWDYGKNWTTCHAPRRFSPVQMRGT